MIDEYSNICFTVIFCLEAAIKIFALRFLYFNDGWNWFDLLICLVSVLDVSISFMKVSFLRVLRVGRVIARILRTLRLATLVKKFKKKDEDDTEDAGRMFLTILHSMTAISSVGGLLLIMLFVFSILGVALFGEAPASSQINSDNNFTTVFQAIRVNLRVMLLPIAACVELSRARVLQVLTGENWPDLMKDLSATVSIAPLYAASCIALHAEDCS
jgi:hypothetical protein